ncbi:hypothetical protein IW261DRAFT_1515189 [Armillaria novae-zelandiae]|uniref:Uncharacterized protein n=1 Tax=Armillaria novae-zelandiae TaxID=153914 RepID=A0AA39NRX6_9AGAR|nr:hypothetical protein IW261DRAFT_1515189 [Armillaria novae-zelandiae]
MPSGDMLTSTSICIRSHATTSRQPTRPMSLPLSRKILSGIVKLLSMFIKWCQIVFSALCTSFYAMWFHVIDSDRQCSYISRDVSEATTREEEFSKICAPEIIETELAQRYGMGDCVDPVAVFQEAKRIAFVNGDPDSISDICNLDKLLHLRMKRNYWHAYYRSQ